VDIRKGRRTVVGTSRTVSKKKKKKGRKYEVFYRRESVA
jgi:hypothetical protein